MNKVRRIYVEKKPGFDVEANHLFEDIRTNLSVDGLTGLRILIRYDVCGISDESYETAKVTIFSEPPVDYIYEEEFEKSFSVPGLINTIPLQICNPCPEVSHS